VTANRPLTILLAEDNALNRKLVMGMLAGTGHRVETACTGAEAVRKYAAAPAAFDMILMDLWMPELDGLGAARAIRALDKSLRVPIIAMTAHSLSAHREACLEAGMDDYLPKPVDRKNLVEMMERWASPNGPSRPIPGRTFRRDLAGCLGLQEDDFSELLDLFIETSFRDLHVLRRALDGNDGCDAAHAAHSIKGAASNLGLEQLSFLAAAVERGAVTGRLGDAVCAVEAIGVALEHLAGGLKAG